MESDRVGVDTHEINRSLDSALPNSVSKIIVDARVLFAKHRRQLWTQKFD